MNKLDAMKAFSSVVQTGGFTAAAKRDGVSQSAVSKKVAALEKHLGVDLLRRNCRALSLTEVGAEYYGVISGILEDLKNAESRVTGGIVTSQLRISMSPVLSRLIMSPLIAEFLGKHHQVRISLDLTETHRSIVAEGFDVAIRATDLEDSSLRYRLLSSNPLMLAASEDYLRTHGEPAEPGELARHSCLGFSRFDKPLNWRLRRGKQMESVKVNSRYDCNQGDSLVEMAKLGLGIIMMPQWVMKNELKGGRLIPVLPAWKPPTLPLNIIYSGSHSPPVKTRKFIDFIVREVRDRKLLPA